MASITAGRSPLPKTTVEFRTMMKKRSAAHWNDAISELDQAAE